MSITFRLPYVLTEYNIGITFFFMRRIFSLMTVSAIIAGMIPLSTHAE